MVSSGRNRGMAVTGYFCAGANTRWGQDHPDWSYGMPSNTHHIRYLDYLGKAMEDAIRKTGIDGYMIDWVWNPAPKLRAQRWIECELRLFPQLTGKPFSSSGAPAVEDVLDYERRAIGPTRSVRSGFRVRG